MFISLPSFNSNKLPEMSKKEKRWCFNFISNFKTFKSISNIFGIIFLDTDPLHKYHLFGPQQQNFQFPRSIPNKFLFHQIVPLYLCLMNQSKISLKSNFHLKFFIITSSENNQQTNHNHWIVNVAYSVAADNLILLSPSPPSAPFIFRSDSGALPNHHHSTLPLNEWWSSIASPRERKWEEINITTNTRSRNRVP